jgi:hypothetical protein
MFTVLSKKRQADAYTFGLTYWDVAVLFILRAHNLYTNLHISSSLLVVSTMLWAANESV